MTEQNSPQEVKEVHIQQAQMTRDENGAYLGQVVFGVDGQSSVYEITFHSKRERNGITVSILQESHGWRKRCCKWIAGLKRTMICSIIC